MSPRQDAPPVEELLAQVPLFSRLGPREIRKLARLCVRRRFEPGELLIEEGAVGLGMFVLTGGRVEVFKHVGGEQLRLGETRAGEILGEIALIDDQPRSASAEALEPTDCLLLTKQRFDRLVRKEPQIAWCIVPTLADRIRELHDNAVATEQRLRRLEEKTAATGVAGEAAIGDGDGDGDGDGGPGEGADGSTAADDAVSRLLRLQFGLLSGGAAAMVGMAGGMEEFMRTLADDADLAESDSLERVAERVPESLTSAMRAMLQRMEEVPQEMVDAFRRYSED